MTEPPPPATAADLLVRRLRIHGVDHVFGYPGGQLTPLYDALHRTPGVRHVLARDEQAAAFMADGFARSTGRPGVCLAVCGPGVFNAFTPLATAYTDSVPVLVVSGQVPNRDGVTPGLRSGYYHENEQLRASETLTKWRCRVDDPAALAAAVDRAIAEMTTGRPGPVLLEVPVNVLRSDAVGPAAGQPPTPNRSPPAPTDREVSDLAALLTRWRRPLILAGGGVVTAEASPLLVQLAERLGAPVFHTGMGKSAFPGDHPLAAGLTWHRATSDLSNMAGSFSALFEQADGLLAVGCRFSQLTTGSWSLPMPPELAHLDIDPEEIGRHYPVTLGVAADARATLGAVLEELPPAPRPNWAGGKNRAIRGDRWRLPGLDLLAPMRRVLARDAIVVADITRLAYMMLVDFPVYEPRTFLHPAGFVSMAYGIPAALGARAAFPDRQVVTVVGDGCFLMSGMELASAVEEQLPIVVILVNDGSLSLIKAIQQRRYECRYLGVDLRNPDFGVFCQAFGVRHWAADSDATFEAALCEALAAGLPAVVEVRIG